MDNLVITPKSNGQAVIYSERARQYARAGKAENTKRAYRSGWRDFETWCMAQGRRSLPATVETVVEYLTHLAARGQKLSTINVKRAAISSAHVMAGAQDPTKHGDVTSLMKGITRSLAKLGKTTPAKKAPVTLEDLRAMLATIDTGTIAGKRDKAILLIGYAGAFRRSELVNVNVEDVRTNGHLVIVLPTSKTDQEGQGLKKHIEALEDVTLCPVQAYREYLDAAGINSGPVFRRLNRFGQPTGHRLTAQSVALIVKRMARDAGMDWRAFSGHSLRAGFVTSAHLAGAGEADIMKQTGHKSRDTLQGYIRDAGMGARNAMKAAFGEGA
jgi:site-specific recombinase XerD